MIKAYNITHNKEAVRAVMRGKDKKNKLRIERAGRNINLLLSLVQSFETKCLQAAKCKTAEFF
ncbi:hypothetical protein T01_4468 [Trichinella spiralis]|uniref:Uncharacterized protein n=1 Tax=Trichinella spiralis TaxID=6334 RepID=A0A0V1BIV9_TRISP|nr:hypothetical protein T01_4468 [Trichinella spiralis]